MLILAVLAACQGGQATPSPQPEPATQLAPTPTATPTQPPQPTAQTGATPTAAASGPLLIDQFRAMVYAETESIFPLIGQIDHPVRLEVTVVAGEVDPVVAVNNAEGNRLIAADAGGIGEPETIGQFEFPGVGAYELSIASAAGEGEVVVSVYQLEPDGRTGGGAIAAIPGEAFGTIEAPGTYHTYRITVERGQRFDLSAQAISAGLDLLFYLYSPDGRQVAAQDDNVGLDPYLWNYMPDQSGVYTMVVANYDESVGDYVVRAFPSTSAGEAVFDTATRVELITSPRRSTWLGFDGQALDGVAVFVTPANPRIDVAISITDPYGNRLMAVNEWGPGYQEKMSLVQFPFDGEYQLEMVSVTQGGPVDYSLRRVPAAEIAQGGELPKGTEGRSGLVPGTGTVLAYTFEGTQGEVIGIDAHAKPGARLDLGFSLFGPDGALVASSDDTVGRNPQLPELALPVSGTYRLAVWNAGRTFGHFEVLVTTPLAAPAGQEP